MRVLTRALVRAAVLIALTLAQFWAWARADQLGANIGAGLIAFAVVIVVCAAWAGLDARRLSLRTVVLAWTGTAILTAAVGSFLPQLGESGAFDWAVWRSDLLALTPLWLLIVLGPAVVAGSLVGALSGDRSEPGPR